MDTKREAELRELDAQIDDVARYNGVQYQLAEDALQSAILARGLGRTRNEIEGRLVRAERVAAQVGHSQQRLRIAYTKAWTYYWWFDDVQALNQYYDEIASLALKSYETSDVEMLVNVWQLLKAHIRHGKINVDNKKWNEQTAQLTSHLDKLACDRERPNNGLFAYSLRLLIDLNNAIEAPSEIDEILKKFKSTLEAGNSLGNYPLEPFAEIVMELGDVLPDNKSYDDLFETLVAILEKRRSEGEGGQELLRRGYQKLRASKNYDAIRLLGRAQEKLIKQEYRSELVAALVGCASAYEQAGLLWAARTNMLSALAQAFLVYTQEGLLIPSALNCLKKLAWLELQLGRVPHVLNFIEAADATASQLQLDKPLFEKYLKEREQQDAILGILLLKSTLVDLRQLGRLPGALEELQLPVAPMAMLYTLGEEYPRKEGWVPKEMDDKAVQDFFLQWLAQPAADQLPAQPEFLLTPTTILRSSILGCEVICISQNNLESIQLSEIILGALESLLATSLDAPIFPYRQKLTIRISPDKDNDDLPQLKIDNAHGEPTVLINHPISAPSPTQEKRKEFRIRLMQIVSQILPYIFVAKDEEKFIERLGGEESAFSRAFDFCEIAIIIRNILGEAPKFRSSDWLQDEKATNFELQRTSVWYKGIKPEEEKPKTESLWSKKLGTGEAPAELRNVERLKHQDRKISSPIDIPLWDKAKWSATAYGFSPGVAPLLMIVYKNAEAAQSIFRGWLNQIGQLDSNNLIRISILTGVSQKNPAAYTVIIGADPTVNADFQGEVVLVSRLNHMNPRTSQNLENFLRQWNQSKRYVLIPAHFVDESTMPILFTELGIGKTHLSVRPAWQVGENDPDSCGLLEEDEPIIPEDVRDAPVLKTLERIRKRRKQNRG